MSAVAHATLRRAESGVGLSEALRARLAREMDQTVFSVVMPAYNTAATIGAAVDSVLAQTRPDFELIVVDDGSTDETSTLVEAIRDPRLRLIRQENRGAAAARNAAVVEARGRYVSFVDSDDLWLPTYLETMASTLELASPEVGFAYTDAWMLDPTGSWIGTSTAMTAQRPPATPPPTAEALLLELLDRNFVYNAVTVRRTVLEQVGPFDQALRAAIDYEMWIRIAAHGHTALRAPGLLAVYRCSRPGSISLNRDRVYSSMLQVYEGVAADPLVSQLVRDTAARRIAVIGRALEQHRQSQNPVGVWPPVRAILGRVKRAVLPPPAEWRTVPPPEITAAFPDLLAETTEAV